MADDDEKPEAELTDEQLDEDERALRALRIDLPGTGGAPSGIISMAVTNRLPKKEFFRCHPTNTVVVPMVDHVRGMDVEYNIVAPSMVAELASIDIDALPYRLWQTLTAEGASIIIPVRQADLTATKIPGTRPGDGPDPRAIGMAACEFGQAEWTLPCVRGAAKALRRPGIPDLSMAKTIRLAFTDRGRLIDSPQHPLFLKWAGRDAEK